MSAIIMTLCLIAAASTSGQVERSSTTRSVPVSTNVPGKTSKDSPAINSKTTVKDTAKMRPAKAHGKTRGKL